jgi:hypothetical protein
MIAGSSKCNHQLTTSFRNLKQKGQEEVAGRGSRRKKRGRKKSTRVMPESRVDVCSINAVIACESSAMLLLLLLWLPALLVLLP